MKDTDWSCFATTVEGITRKALVADIPSKPYAHHPDPVVNVITKGELVEKCVFLFEKLIEQKELVSPFRCILALTDFDHLKQNMSRRAAHEIYPQLLLANNRFLLANAYLSQHAQRRGHKFDRYVHNNESRFFAPELTPPFHWSERYYCNVTGAVRMLESKSEPLRTETLSEKGRLIAAQIPSVAEGFSNALGSSAWVEVRIKCLLSIGTMLPAELERHVFDYALAAEGISQTWTSAQTRDLQDRTARCIPSAWTL